MTDATNSVHLLYDLEKGQTATVLNVSKEDEDARCRLLTLGIYPGVEVKFLRTAPLGDPMQIRCGSTLISIRKQDASLIEVDLCLN